MIGVSAGLKWTIIISISFTFILFALPVIIYHQVVKPKHPTFAIDQATIPVFNLTKDSHLIAFFNIQIRAHNPNHKLNLKYRNVRVSIFKDNQNLGTDALPAGFTQRKGNVTVLRAEPVALDVALKKGPAFDFGFEKGMGYVEFDVFVTANVNWRRIKVDCKHVVVHGTVQFQTRSCSVSVKSIPGRTY